MYADERLLAAAKADNTELLNAVIKEGGYDINFQDGYVELPELSF